jgi:hypothetical protein
LKLGGMGVVELAWLVRRLRTTVENVHEVAESKERIESATPAGEIRLMYRFLLPIRRGVWVYK